MNPPANLKSLLAKLRNVARAERFPPDSMLLLYMQQGFLARLSISPYREQLILKGGLNLYSRYRSKARPTRDIDFAGRNIANTSDAVAKVVADISSQVLEDGLRFDIHSLRTQPILETATYTGVGISIVGYFEDAFETLQIDVSFGNVITTAPVTLSFPNLLNQDTYPLLGYPLETIIAEKVAAAVEIGIATTRLKDFYDFRHMHVSLLNKAGVDARTIADRIGHTDPSFTLKGILMCLKTRGKQQLFHFCAYSLIQVEIRTDLYEKSHTGQFWIMMR